MSATEKLVLKRHTILSRVISYVGSAIETETRDISVAKVLEAIRTGGEKLRGQIEQIRNRFEAELAITGGDLKAAKRAVEGLKKALPAVTWSGRFSYRASDKLLQHSGLLCADCDHLGDKLPEIRKKLKASHHVYALFLSPTGNGLKAVFRVPGDGAKHPGSFRAVEAHVKQLTGVQIDESGSDVSRLCFMSYDPELYHNPNATELELLPEPEKSKAPTNGVINLSERQRIACELLGAVEWQSETSGFVTCPGKHLHTTGDGERDCRVDFDRVPTVHCFHNSCRSILDGVNHELRSRIGKAEYKHQTPLDEAAAQPSDDSKSEDETIRRLAEMSLLEYEKVRRDEAERLGCRESVLDKLVEAKRPKNREKNSLQGNTVQLRDVEPWPDPVDGAEILDAVSETFRRHVVLPDGAADTCTLWCAAAHVYDVFPCSPRLNARSAEPECGKTTLRDVTGLFVPRPVLTENLTVAVLFRLVNAHKPVILADECDAWMRENEEMRGLLNAGHRRGAMVYRCEGDGNEVRGFNAYAPAMLCGIDALPGTLHDRSIVIRLERAKSDEPYVPFDSEKTENETKLCRKLSRWCADNRQRFAAVNPKLTAGVFNRVADNWRPLFKIAEVAGGDWPKRCADRFR